MPSFAALIFARNGALTSDAVELGAVVGPCVAVPAGVPDVGVVVDESQAAAASPSASRTAIARRMVTLPQNGASLPLAPTCLRVPVRRGARAYVTPAPRGRYA